MFDLCENVGRTSSVLSRNESSGGEGKGQCLRMKFRL